MTSLPIARLEDGQIKPIRLGISSEKLELIEKLQRAIELAEFVARLRESV